ncbi:hypothetical protein Csa_006673, partial [Cucumis sativus]
CLTFHAFISVECFTLAIPTHVPSHTTALRSTHDDAVVVSVQSPIANAFKSNS